MKNFFDEIKKSVDNLKDGQPSSVKIEKPKVAPKKTNDEWVCSMVCDLFGGERVAIVHGKGFLKVLEDDKGYAIHFRSGKIVECNCVVFFKKELEILFGGDHGEEQFIAMYQAKKIFGSGNMVIENDESVKEIQSAKRV